MKLPWPRRSVVPLERLRDDTPDALKDLSAHDLYRYISGWKVGSVNHVIGMAEIRRREGRVAWWALVVSVVSLIVAGAALLTGS